MGCVGKGVAFHVYSIEIAFALVRTIQDWAWATRDEAVAQLVGPDARLRALLGKMLG